MKTLPPPANATIKEALAYLHLSKVEQLRALEARGVLRIVTYNARVLRVPWDDLRQVNDRLIALEHQEPIRQRRSVRDDPKLYADAVRIYGTNIPGLGRPA
jgi:hypothetical protein